jgi:CRISPR system Cascade subunit CasB
MRRFIDWLEGLNEKDTRVRAVLRRGLSFAPGEYVPAFPYVEPFIKSDATRWQRQVYHLVAGLWASHWREGRSSAPLTIGRACAAHQAASGSTNTERRFIALLDADLDQLPHRLRQMIALLKEQPLDFDALLNDLLYWNNDQKRTQHVWARDFYQNSNEGLNTKTTTEEENQ